MSTDHKTSKEWEKEQEKDKESFWERVKQVSNKTKEAFFDLPGVNNVVGLILGIGFLPLLPISVESSLLVIFTLIGIVVLWTVWPLIIGAAFIPTPIKTVRKMLDLADLKENDFLIDLGSGDGRIVIEAAKNYKAHALGIEADPLRVFWSRLKIRSNNIADKVEVIWGNFFSINLSKATVITVFQGIEINNRLKTKFEEELEPGSRVVSYSFKFDGWVPFKKDPDLEVYLYKIPTK